MLTTHLTTHVLDTALGQPAASIVIRLLDAEGNELSSRVTDSDGRVKDLITPEQWRSGAYTLVFETAAYFSATNRTCFYPDVSVHFTVTDPQQHHHVPLLLSPFGYSTYRGS